MKSFDFLKNKLDQLSKRFLDVKFRYQYDEYEGEHIIEVTPDRVYSNSKEYAIAESRVMKEFAKEYLSESILFVSDQSIIKVNDDAIEFYVPIKIASWINLLNENINEIQPIYNYKNECINYEVEALNYKLAA